MAGAAKLAQSDSAKLAGASGTVAFDHSADNIKTLRHEYANEQDAKRA